MSVRFLGAAVLVIAALYTWYSQSYAASFGDVLGPSVFPVIVGIPVMLLAGSLVLVPSGQVIWPGPGRLWRLGAALAVLLGYAAVLLPLGFPLATFMLIALLGLILGGPVVRTVCVAAVMAPGLWALFDQVLGLPLAFLGRLFG